MEDEDERSPPLIRPRREPGPFLDRQSGVENALLVERLADDLQAERQPGAVEPLRQRLAERRAGPHRNSVGECAGRFGGNCGQPIASFKWASRFSWVDGPLTMSVQWTHLSGVNDADDAVDYAAFNGIERIGAYDLFDLSLSFEASENVTFSMGVNNLFDTLPGSPTFNGIEVSNRPNSLLLGDNQEQANTYPSLYDVLGRDFFASIAFSF